MGGAPEYYYLLIMSLGSLWVGDGEEWVLVDKAYTSERMDHLLVAGLRQERVETLQIDYI